MLRPVNGVLVVEDEQTGDGRYIVPGAITWGDLPLPLAWIEDGDQHVDMVMAAPQIGNILTIERVGNEILFTGQIDDEIEEGADLLRRMGAGSAGLGSRQGISIDPDDWAYDIVDTTEQIITASVSGHGAVLAPSVRAAAGDGEPTGVVVWSDASDEYVMRFTRLRIRGVTGCSVAAFMGAWMEITDTTQPVAEPAPAAPAAETVTASVTVPAAPPLPWFNMAEPEFDDERMIEQYDAAGNPIGFACPLTITDDGQVFGHLAASWGQCHVGYQQCTSPPASMTNYAHFHVGETACDNGERVATGVLVAGCDHAAAHLLTQQARDHYANVGLAWARGRVSDGEFAPWFCGALMPGLDEATVTVLRASALSGDWRRIGGALELIAVQSVNSPGFPVGREALAASALEVLPEVGPTVFVGDDGLQTALVAAAPVQRCAECAERAHARLQMRTVLGDNIAAMVERRTRHMIPAAREAFLAQIRKPA